LDWTGDLLSSFAFSFAWVIGITLTRRKSSRRKIKRFLCLALSLAGLTNISGQWPVVSGQSRNDAPNDSQARSSKSNQAIRSRASEAYGNLPLSFEANQGQADSKVKFLSRGNACNVFLKTTGAVMSLRGGQGLGVGRQGTTTYSPATDHPPLTTDDVRMRLLGANPAPRMTGLDELTAVSNYFIGNDTTKWLTNVPAYARVKCEDVYPGVDMVYYGNQRQLEYDFKLAPGADPRAVRLKFDGAETIAIDKDGDLVLGAAGAEIRQRKPVAYQDVNGVRREVPCRYALRRCDASIRDPQSAIRSQEIGFEIGAYDATKPLIIDPVLAYSTYLGGSGDDEGNSITVDAAGNVYVVGFTDSPNFPTSAASQPTLGGGQQDVFLAKLNPSGTQLIYSAYLGGNGQDNGSGIAVDSGGNAYITGFTGSTNFPVRNAMQPAKNGPFNAFVAKLDAAGSLLYSTLLGGSVGDYGSSITVDSAGSVYVAGVATSPNFPMVKAIQPAFGGAADVYVAKLNAAGAQLVYSTYLGGSGNDGAASIAVDSAGNLYITGVTTSTDFRTANPLQASHGGGLFDAFVAKLNPSGTQLIYSTYLGGSGEDRGFRITADSVGNAYVTGDTDSTNFPTTGALQTNIGGSVDAFAAKINPSGSALVYSTYLGGSGIDGATAIAVDSNGSAYVTGFTGSTDFPTSDALQPVSGGGSFDAFVAKLNPSGTALDYSTYLGGAGIDAGFGIAVDSSGNAYVMGQTDSTGFPTASPLQPTNGGGSSDVFIAKIVPTVASGPHITGASVSGKKLSVFGSGFDSGAKVLLNGESQKTSNDDQNPATALIARKSGNKITPGQTATLQVRNADGTLSNQFSFTR
jgi:hypothetical protein